MVYDCKWWWKLFHNSGNNNPLSHTLLPSCPPARCLPVSVKIFYSLYIHCNFSWKSPVAVKDQSNIQLSIISHTSINPPHWGANKETPGIADYTLHLKKRIMSSMICSVIWTCTWNHTPWKLVLELTQSMSNIQHQFTQIAWLPSIRPSPRTTMETSTQGFLNVPTCMSLGHGRKFEEPIQSPWPWSCEANSSHWATVPWKTPHFPKSLRHLSFYTFSYQ